MHSPYTVPRGVPHADSSHRRGFLIGKGLVLHIHVILEGQCVPIWLSLTLSWGCKSHRNLTRIISTFGTKLSKHSGILQTQVLTACGRLVANFPLKWL